MRAEATDWTTTRQDSALPGVAIELLGEYATNPTRYAEYTYYPYESWEPSQQRRSFVARHAAGCSVLDFGCGGHPVTRDVKAAYKVGVDISPKAAQMARDSFDRFFLLDLSRFDLSALNRLGRFDTIVASEVLEHSPEPETLLASFRTVLNPGGRIIITIPNGRSLAALVDKALHRGLYERFRVYHQDHVSLFSRRQWERLFLRSGLRVEVFEFRPSDVVEGFPNEAARWWKAICSLCTGVLAHQYYYVLREA